MGVKLTRCLGGPEASMPGSHCLTLSGGWAAIFCVLPSSPARRKWPTGVSRFLGQSLSGLFIKQVERELSSVLHGNLEGYNEECWGGREAQGEGTYVYL